MDDALRVLKRHFGYDAFRRGQEDVVASVLAGRDTIGVLPTGGGKSLCYQVPALVLPGLTVVISPLISLMKDQVDRLETLGVAATYLNSTLSPAEVRARLDRVSAGAMKLLYVAPERFEARDLRERLAASGVAMLAVDEAHCISEWGHEFRPSFRRIATVSRALRIPQTIALTATATPRVRGDIARQLELDTPNIVVGGFDRSNLQYAVARCRDEKEKWERLLRLLRAHERPAIVYAPTRASVDRLARALSKAGFRTSSYHGGMDDDERQRAQDAFMTSAAECLVATNAFGMGIDKPNVRLVVHHAMPGTLEAYYQEAGRASRDGQPGLCVLLHAPGDRETQEWFIGGTFPARHAVVKAYDAMRRSSFDGRVIAPLGREGESIVRFLELNGVLRRVLPDRNCVHVRLLATPQRVARELAGHGGTLAVLEALGRLAGDRLSQGLEIDVRDLPDGQAGAARASLEWLRDHQFLAVQEIGGGLELADPRRSALAIDWARVERRIQTERSKLAAMEEYVRTTSCRRAFVLRYFGERSPKATCAGCDNCLRGSTPPN